MIISGAEQLQVPHNLAVVRVPLAIRSPSNGARDVCGAIWGCLFFFEGALFSDWNKGNPPPFVWGGSHFQTMQG